MTVNKEMKSLSMNYIIKRVKLDFNDDDDDNGNGLQVLLSFSFQAKF